MAGRRVLLTNCWLQTRAGTEMYVRDLALALRRAGHEALVWSPMLGAVADDMRSAGIPVFGDLARVPQPELLHCHQHDETVAALSRFPDQPGLFVQHGDRAWQDMTPLHPRLLRYVAVDRACLDRMLTAGVDPALTTVVYNSVDLERFGARDPLPQRPRRALVFSNYAGASTYIPAVRAACERMGLEVDVAGAASGAPMTDPEAHLPRYDLVFAKARAALEALAVGCAVVLTDADGVGGMVSSDVLAEWRTWNFGHRLLSDPHDVDVLCAQIDRYDPADAERCSAYVRANCGLDAMVELLVAEYDNVLRKWNVAPAPDHRAELVAASTRLALIGPMRAREEAERPYVENYPNLARAYEEAVSHAQALREDRDGYRDVVNRLRSAPDASSPTP